MMDAASLSVFEVYGTMTTFGDHKIGTRNY